jgi:phenylacetate-CoA ligase
MNWIKRLLNSGYLTARSRVERTIPFWPLERIERLQRYRLRAIIRHAYDTVPFYRKAMDERGLHQSDFRTVADLSKLPLIDGITVRKNTEAFLSTHYGDDCRRGFYSAGTSSGVRRLIYWDESSILAQLVHHARSRGILSSLLGHGLRPPSVSIVALDAPALTLRAFWEASMLIPPMDAQHHALAPEQPLEVTAERINTIRPHLVFSYGSWAEHFFRFVADRQMSLAAPDVWIYSGDMLSPAGRELIEREYGCLTYSDYQSTETGRLGFECERRQGFHLNDDLCAVRLVDQEGSTVRPGEVGEIVISNLFNRAMVLLNYRLEDWGVMASEPCPCGRSLPLLERLEGRRSEVLYRADGRGIPHLTLEGLCEEALEPALQVQILQPAMGQIRWRIVPCSGADPDAVRRDILDRCCVLLGQDTQVEVEFVEDIPMTGQGKFLRVISHVEAPDAQAHNAAGHLSE